MVAGRRVIDWTLDAFRGCALIDRIVVVIPPDGGSDLPDDVSSVIGGDSRTASVRAGLDALDGTGTERVLVHDAARACVTPEIIEAVVAALDTHKGAAPGLAVTDALWRGDASRVVAAPARDGLYRAQTPQGFHIDKLKAAHAADHGSAADDVALAIAAGVDVAIVPGDEDNIKITTPQDFARAARILTGRSKMDIRLGNGYDVHAFGPGDHVTLCGIALPFDQGLKGHSDADVAMHAVTDALYGALAEGDIGRHFPPSDPQWKGAASHIFLEHAAKLVADKGYAVSNLDCTIVCELPKIGPHAASMEAKLAAIVGITADRVSVKATTSEQLGFTGRGEGIAALATATLVGA